VINVILVLLLATSVGWDIIVSGRFSKDSMLRMASIKLEIYFLWVVWCFCEELKSDRSSSSQEKYFSNVAYYPEHIQSDSSRQHRITTTNKAGGPNWQINV